MSALLDKKITQKVDERYQKPIEHIVEINQYLNKENEVEFFKNASVIFEKLLKRVYLGKKKNVSYFECRQWLRKELEKYDIM